MTTERRNEIAWLLYCGTLNMQSDGHHLVGRPLYCAERLAETQKAVNETAAELQTKLQVVLGDKTPTQQEILEFVVGLSAEVKPKT